MTSALYLFVRTVLPRLIKSDEICPFFSAHEISFLFSFLASSPLNTHRWHKHNSGILSWLIQFQIGMQIAGT